MPSSKVILVIPHVGLGGGAGIYNCDLISALNKKGSVFVSGEFSLEYVDLSEGVFNETLTTKIIFPNYDGVSIVGKIYWLFFSIFSGIFLFIKKTNTVKSLINVDVIFFTSSIQIPHAYFLRKLGFQGKIICVVQENLKLEGFFGFLVRCWIESVDSVIGITNDWCAYANAMSIKTDILSNKFRTKTPDVNENPEFDAIYVGGESKLKGIDFVLKLFEELSLSRTIKIILLGVYSDSFLNKIIHINEKSVKTGSQIVVGGYVTDIQPHLANSKVLLMPIAAPHFCRPAIEAGFSNRTFIIPDYKELKEFVLPSYNCLTYEIGSFKDFRDVFIYLLESPELKTNLEDNNVFFAYENYSDNEYCSNLNKIY